MRLVYYGHRYYSPSTGRWLSRDLIGENGGLNLYAFCQNDAIGKRDRLGLESDEVFCAKVCDVAYLTDLNSAGGRVICFQGKACPCVFDQSDYGHKRGMCPAIDAVILDHETNHMKNDVKPCDSCRTDMYQALWKDGIKERQVHCAQWRKDLGRFQKLNADGSQTGQCSTVLDTLIEFYDHTVKDCALDGF